MKVDFSREATYLDAEGNPVSAFSRNQSLIRVVLEHDIGFRHPEGWCWYRRPVLTHPLLIKPAYAGFSL